MCRVKLGQTSLAKDWHHRRKSWKLLAQKSFRIMLKPRRHISRQQPLSHYQQLATVGRKNTQRAFQQSSRPARLMSPHVPHLSSTSQWEA